jgi:hypothetical protein
MRGARFVRRFFRAVLFSSGVRFVRCSFRAAFVSCGARKEFFDGASIAIIDVERSRPRAKKFSHVWSALIGMDGIARQNLFLHF